MLELRNIKKTYHVGDIETKALDGISVAFRQKEFVAILGTSGSGKTTALNIIGGLDRYDDGELLIKGKSTKKFNDKDWDAYRNNSIGFVFQSYNLINHISIVANVEMSMTLSGVSKKEKHRRALEVLEQVGLKDHLHKKPNQLSGGQMQRVAIARALANNPEILLCDEPTGALDTATSAQIMDLIKELSKDRLVIMVTHNPEIAEKYSDRIIRFSDGKIVDDTHPHQERPKPDDFKLTKTSMGFLTALSLSFNNIRTKKGRTFLTAFASSIGIIGIALILSLSNGVKIQIDDFQSDAMSEFPVIITKSAMSVDAESIAALREQNDITVTEDYPTTDSVLLHDSGINSLAHTNKFTDEFIDYIDSIDPEYCKSVGYVRLVAMNILTKKGDETVATSLGLAATSETAMSGMTSMANIGLSTYPEYLSKDDGSYLEANYELLAGAYPQEVTDIILVIDKKNRIDKTAIEALGFDTANLESIKFSDIVGKEYKLIFNNEFYTKSEFGNFMPNYDYDALYDNENNLTLKVCGIVRKSEESNIGVLGTGLAYSDALSKIAIENAEQSDVIKAQLESDKSVFTLEDITAEQKELFIQALGGVATPYMIMLYPQSFEQKEDLTDYLDKFNEGKTKDDMILYTDLAATISSMTGDLMDVVTYVLIGFAGVSLFVSLIMICIITYTSVLERTKEIGILKALGARKKDITRVFNAETFILGLFSGALGIGIAYALLVPINMIINNLAGYPNVAQLNPLHALFLLVISTVLTVLGGYIPAIMASRKDAVDALRSE